MGESGDNFTQKFVQAHPLPGLKIKYRLFSLTPGDTVVQTGPGRDGGPPGGDSGGMLWYSRSGGKAPAQMRRLAQLQ